MNFDVSVIVASYNPKLAKLLGTIRSILLQKNVSMEIILVDDGSDNNFFAEVRKLYKDFSFDNHVEIGHKRNVGTVKNLYSGIEIARGKYIKMLSPGDLLYSDYSMARILRYMDNMNASLCFSEAVYYCENNNQVKALEVPNRPYAPYLYDDLETNDYKRDYLLFNDVIPGAVIWATTLVYQKYFPLILGKVKYAEDYIYRIMLADGIRMFHYTKRSIWYEFWTGISTSNDELWEKRIMKDRNSTNIILKDYLQGDNFYNFRFRIVLRFENNAVLRRLVKSVLFPFETIKQAICMFHPVNTPTENVNFRFYYKCMMEPIK